MKSEAYHKSFLTTLVKRWWIDRRRELYNSTEDGGDVMVLLLQMAQPYKEDKNGADKSINPALLNLLTDKDLKKLLTYLTINHGLQ